MKKKLPTLLLVLSLIVTLFAGCATEQEALAPSTDNALTEDGHPTAEPSIAPPEDPKTTEEPTVTTAPTTLPDATDVPLPTEASEPTAAPEPTTPEPTTTPKPTATPQPTATPKPTATPMPTATPIPTATPMPTATPKPTATPIPTATPMPTATPAVSEITVNAKKVADFNTYTCSERGEEAKAIVLQLREQQPRLRGTKPMINELKTNYDFSEEDILWAVYTSGWPEEALHYANSIIENNDFSRLLLLDSLNDDFSYIESDVRYALDNCTADWKQEALGRTKWLLDQEFGMSYVRLVESLKLRLFTDEDIEYVLANLTIDWIAEAEEAAHDILNTGGLSRQRVIRNLVLRKFSTEQALAAVERLDVDWIAEAEEAACDILNSKETSRQELIDTLVEIREFSTEQAISAIEHLDVDWEEKEKEYLATVILKDVDAFALSRQGVIDRTKRDGYEETIILAVIDTLDIDWIAEARDRLDYLLKEYNLTRLEYLDRLQNSYYFTKTEAEAAVAQSGVNWMEQAVRSMQHTVDKHAQSYDDLVFNFKDRCSKEELEYALSHIVADWDLEASQKAEWYINSGHNGYSPEGLVDHLMSSHGFTKEQATYGRESLGDVDWNKQAVNSMRWFMNGGHSREKLIEILREDKFTEEQINYALKVCNPK